MRSDAATVDEYLAELPEARRPLVAAVRGVIASHLADGFEEGMLNGAIAYYVPLARHRMPDDESPLLLADLRNLKRYVLLRLMNLSLPGATALAADWGAAGVLIKHGDVKLRALGDIPLEVPGRVIASTSVDDLISEEQCTRSFGSGPGA